MQTILLDSSFLFPYIQIDIKSVKNKDLLTLIESDEYEVQISDISLFELSAKANKYVRKNVIEISDLTDGINTIVNEDRIHRIPYHYSEIQLLAHKMGNLHLDFIDCLILATANYHSDIFLTLDEPLIKLIENNRKELDIDKLQIIGWQDFMTD